MQIGLENSLPDETTNLASLRSAREEREYEPGLEPTPCENLGNIKVACPLLPYEELPTGMTSEHHAAHASDRPELLLVENGILTRTVRLQEVQGRGGSILLGNQLESYHLEHTRYHYFCNGPEWLPTNEDEQFEYGIWMGSLYVPEYGLDVRGEKLKIRKMTPEQIKRLHNGEVRVGSPQILNRFLRKYVVQKGIPFIDEDKIERFITTKSIDLKQKLGREILAAASKVAAEPIEKEYRKAHQNGRIHPSLEPEVAKVVELTVIQGRQSKMVRHIQEGLGIAA